MAIPKLVVQLPRQLEQQIKVAAKRQQKSVSELLTPILEREFGSVNLTPQPDVPTK